MNRHPTVQDFFNACFVIGLSPDGWVVLFDSNVAESEEYMMQIGRQNAAHYHVDPATLKVIWRKTATEEELLLRRDFLALHAYLARHFEVEYGITEPTDDDPGHPYSNIRLSRPKEPPDDER